MKLFFYGNAKKTNETKKKKNETNFYLATDSLSGKYETISIKFKIGISLLIAKMLHKQRTINQIRDYLIGYIQI